MKKELIIISSELLQEIEELKTYKNLVSHKKLGHVVNFVIKQHYGDTYMKDYERISIPVRFTKRLLNVVDDIISELEIELENL